MPAASAALSADELAGAAGNPGLQRALNRAHLLKQEIAEYYSNYRVTSDLVELRNLALVAELIIRSALGRHESCGLHYTLDFAGLAPDAEDTILAPG